MYVKLKVVLFFALKKKTKKSFWRDFGYGIILTSITYCILPTHISITLLFYSGMPRVVPMIQTEYSFTHILRYIYKLIIQKTLKFIRFGKKFRKQLNKQLNFISDM